jgi:Uma2 family endonuclease
MAIPLKRKLGYVDYERLPADGKRYEILDGELYVTPAPSPLHQRLSKRLQRRLEDYFEARSIGEVFNAPIDLILGDHDIAQPDLLIAADPAQVSDRGIERAALMVIEILSPSTRALDRGAKMRRYADRGVAHYWIVDPDAQRIECFRLEAGEYRRVVGCEVPDVLSHPDWTDLRVPLADLWR